MSRCGLSRITTTFHTPIATAVLSCQVVAFGEAVSSSGLEWLHRLCAGENAESTEEPKVSAATGIIGHPDPFGLWMEEAVGAENGARRIPDSK